MGRGIKMRTVKKAEDRKNEILDAADVLFNQYGYDKTSTNQILEMVGIARGTLYHHFQSKEAIMDALIERYMIQWLEIIQSAASDTSLDPIERLSQTLRAMKMEEQDIMGEAFEQLHRPENALMHEKLEQNILQNITPVITSVITDGIKEGIFSTPFPYETVELLISSANVIFNNDFLMLSNKEKKTKSIAFVFNIERLLHAEENSLNHLVNILIT